MPATDISEVKIEFGFGVKRGEYEPIKNAKATITAIVKEGEDGVVALNYISKIARDKVGELLALGGPVAEAQTTSQPLATSPQQAAADQAATRRPRRTQAQIAADNAAAEPSAPASEASATSEAPAAEEHPEPAAEEHPEPAAEKVPEGDADDAWASSTEVVITDIELNRACSAVSQKLGGPDKVRALIGKFTGPGSKLTTLLPGQRSTFLAELNALS